MFTQTVTVSSQDLIEFLLNKGYMHKGFKNAMLSEISHIRATDGRGGEIYSTITFKLETKELYE